MNEIITFLKECEILDDTDAIFSNTWDIAEYLVKKGYIHKTEAIKVNNLIRTLVCKNMAVNKRLKARTDLVMILARNVNNMFDKQTAKLERTKKHITSGSWPAVKIAEQ